VRRFNNNITDKNQQICGFCGCRNCLKDECGWVYIYPYYDGEVLSIGKPCCKECWLGEPGQLHRLLYGISERSRRLL
jgi:hypothetical protein